MSRLLFTPNAPTRGLTAVWLYCLVAALLATASVLQTPWLGLQLAIGPQEQIVVTSSQGPAASVPAGATLLALGIGHQTDDLALQAIDLLEEPDVLDSYEEMTAFFARQSAIHNLLHSPEVRLVWQVAGQDTPAISTIAPRPRPLNSLPSMFWFQLAVATVGCLIACWVWVLRPVDWGARMFGLTGLAFPLFAMSAAIYSSRELALDGTMFAALSALNHGGAFLFGAALVGLFLCYPRALVRPQHLTWLFGLYFIWWLADTWHGVPSPDAGHRSAVMSEMLLALLLAGVQWWKARTHPVDRAALRWFAISMLLGSGLFILSNVATVSLGWLPPIPQGYSFGFFLFIYIGIALGLGRYRLFDLGHWAYLLLLWLGSALAVFGLDALFILALDWSAGAALGAAIWICGILYFPARQWLWNLLVHQPRLQLQELMPDLVHIAFTPDRELREQLWSELLQRLYVPLSMQATDKSNNDAQLDEDGLALLVPPCGSLAARTLYHPNRGKSLFSSQDTQFVQALCKLMDQAETSRQAHEQGAKEERRRIARDIHDDVGARLLMLIHSAATPHQAELARMAMNDLRTALNAIDGRSMRLVDALADWRAEAHQRCDSAHVALDWQTSDTPEPIMLKPQHKSLLERALRECLTNALKHAHPSRIGVRIRWQTTPSSIDMTISDDGPSTSPTAWQQGRGLRGLEHRLHEHGGRITAHHLSGTNIQIQLPLNSVETAI